MYLKYKINFLDDAFAGLDNNFNLITSFLFLSGPENQNVRRNEIIICVRREQTISEEEC